MAITLSVLPRTALGKAARSLSAQMQMPAVVYGPKQDSLPITISLLDFNRILRNEGESSVLELTGLTKPMQVLIHEIERDPVTNQPRHADFYAIEKGAKVQVAVPLEFIGESPAVKAGASFVKVLHEVEVEVAPENLPHQIEVDISTLENVGDQIHVSDLKIPTNVTLMTEGDEVVVLIQETVVEEETEASAAPDMGAIEVEQKGKADDAEGEDA